MDALSAIGLCTLSLVWMGVVLFIATDEAHRQRNLSIDHD